MCICPTWYKHKCVGHKHTMSCICRQCENKSTGKEKLKWTVFRLRSHWAPYPWSPWDERNKMKNYIDIWKVNHMWLVSAVLYEKSVNPEKITWSSIVTTELFHHHGNLKTMLASTVRNMLPDLHEKINSKYAACR